ncbi:MAG: LTA synthase family protein [Bdellovibrionales bacterium]|nr:LTA synthase family protein [Bdellovibrionales bacterium]
MKYSGIITRWGAAAYFALLASSVAIRHQLVGDFGVSYAQLTEFKIWVGWIYDATVALIPFALARLLRLARVPPFPAWITAATAIWVVLVANASFFRYFGARLDWWTVKHQWASVGDVEQSAGALAATGPVALSLVFLVLALAAAWKAYGDRPLSGPGWIHGALGISYLVLIVLVRQSPVWMNVVNLGEQNRLPVVSEHALFAWWAEASSDTETVGERVRGDLESARRAGLPGPAELLARFRDFRESEGPPQGASIRARENPAFPMLRTFEPGPEEAKALRERLGLDVSKPVKVLVLILETVRAFEYLHPETGPVVFPRLRSWVGRHGILFQQAYNSSLEMGQTVRGQFSILCSSLPNWGAPAVVIQYSTTEVACLQGVFRDAGHATAWFGGERANFHNKSAFELTHGTREMYGKEYFLARGITERIGDLGVADRPFYQETLRTLESLAPQGGAYFASATNTSTHFPFSELEEAPVPEPLRSRVSGPYRGYLSRLRYLDSALDGLLSAFFQSPASDNAVVVLVGDHSTQVRPPWPLDAVAEEELEYRVFLALLSKGMKRPGEVVHRPVHQVDIAPTVAAAAGLRAPVTWVGRGLFAPEPTPWLLARGNSLSYRTLGRGCYAELSESSPRCFEAEGRDLMMDPERVQVDEDPRLTEFFREVTRANRQALVLNLLAPRGSFVRSVEGRGVVLR